MNENEIQVLILPFIRRFTHNHFIIAVVTVVRAFDIFLLFHKARYMVANYDIIDMIYHRIVESEARRDELSTVVTVYRFTLCELKA